MLGLKSFRTAAVVIAGVELAEKIKKGQFKIGKLGGATATMQEIWHAVLAAIIRINIRCARQTRPTTAKC